MAAVTGGKNHETDRVGSARLQSVADHVDEAAKLAGGNLKWGLDPPDVLPAWIAEHDLGPPPVVREVLRRLADLPDVGYSRRASDLGGALLAVVGLGSVTFTLALLALRGRAQ